MGVEEYSGNRIDLLIADILDNERARIGTFYTSDFLGLKGLTATATSNEIYTPGPGNHALTIRTNVVGTGSITIKVQSSLQGGSGYGDAYSGSNQLITGTLAGAASPGANYTNSGTWIFPCTNLAYRTNIYGVGVPNGT